MADLLNMTADRITVGTSLDTRTPFAFVPNYFTDYMMPLYEARNSLVIAEITAFQNYIDAQYVAFLNATRPAFILTKQYKPAFTTAYNKIQSDSATYITAAAYFGIDSSNFSSAIFRLTTLLNFLDSNWNNTSVDTILSEVNLTSLEFAFISVYVYQMNILKNILNHLSGASDTANTSYYPTYNITLNPGSFIQDDYYSLAGNSTALTASNSYASITAYIDTFLRAANVSVPVPGIPHTTNDNYFQIIDFALTKFNPVHNTLTAAQKTAYTNALTAIKNGILAMLSSTDTVIYQLGPSPLILNQSAGQGITKRTYKSNIDIAALNALNQSAGTVDIGASYFGNLLPSAGYLFDSSLSQFATGGYQDFNVTVNQTIAGFPGNNAFSSAVLLSDGRVFLVPDTSSVAKIFNPITNTFSNASGSYNGNKEFSAGVVLTTGPNTGSVYLVPYNSTAAKLYNPSTDTLSNVTGTIVGGSFAGARDFIKAAILGNYVYLAPFRNLKFVRYNMSTGATNFINFSVAISSANYPTDGGHFCDIVPFTDRLVLVPDCHAYTQVIMLSLPTSAQAILLPTAPFPSKDAPGTNIRNFIRAIKVNSTDAIFISLWARKVCTYFSTFTSSPYGRVVIADRTVANSQVDYFESTTTSSPYPYSSGVMLPNGNALLIPYNAGDIKKIFGPVWSAQATLPTLISANNAAFSDGILLNDGRVLLIPASSTTAIILSTTNTGGLVPYTITKAYDRGLKYNNIFVDIMSWVWPSGTLPKAKKSALAAYIADLKADADALTLIGGTNNNVNSSYYDPITGAYGSRTPDSAARLTALGTAYTNFFNYTDSLASALADTSTDLSLGTGTTEAASPYCNIVNGYYDTSRCLWSPSFFGLFRSLVKAMSDLYYTLKAANEYLPPLTGQYPYAFGIQTPTLNYNHPVETPSTVTYFSTPVSSEAASITNLASVTGVSSSAYSALLPNITTYNNLKDTPPTNAKKLFASKAVFQSYGKIHYTASNSVPSDWNTAGAVIESSAGTTIIGRVDYNTPYSSNARFDNDSSGLNTSHADLLTKTLFVF